MTVTFDNMLGASTDWISIAQQGSDDSAWVAWKYTNGTGVGSNQGSVTFTGVAAGTYEARAYYDWNNTRSVLVRQRSASFTVNALPSVSISTSASSYAEGEQITVNVSDVAGPLATDWISIATQGSSLSSRTAWAYGPGTASGSKVFSGTLLPGTYVARFFRDNSLTLAAQSTAFTVTAATVAVSANTSSYVSGTPITINFSGVPNPTTKDWLAIAPNNSSLTTINTWAYTPGTASGSPSFARTLSPGTYVARLFRNDQYTLAAQSTTFSITAAPTTTLTTNASIYTGPPNITINYSNVPSPSSTDWFAIAPQGSPANSLTTWAYTNGTASGSALLVRNLTPGTYVVRLFQSGYVPLIESSAFNVYSYSGLAGEYFNAVKSVSGTPVLIRNDATVNFDWGTGSPDPLVNADDFAVRWTGYVLPQYSQTYTFYTSTDDGARLWVNNTPLVDDWNNHALTENFGTIALTAGQLYPIRFEFFEGSGGGTAIAKLSWSSSSQSKQIIPQSRLYGVAPPTPVSRTGWTASASATSGSDVPANALDNSLSTRWSSGTNQVNGMWFQVDMQSAQTVKQIIIDSAASNNDYPRGYQVFLSTDGTTWGSAVASGAGTSATILAAFTARTARYIRVTLNTGGSYWWSIHEFTVYR